MQRFEVVLVPLDPALGSEIRKTRPCAIVSPDEMHVHLHTIVIVPLTSGRTGWPTRVPCVFQGRQGELALDQLRSVDRARVRKHLGRLDDDTAAELLRALQHFFC